MVKIYLTFRFSSLAVMEDHRRGTSVDNSIMSTEESTICVQFQRFYDNCNKLMGTITGMKSVSTIKTAKVLEQREQIEIKMYRLHHQLQMRLKEKERLR
jgi:hypothetical protein